MKSLWVEFVGQQIEVTTTLTFGRSADLTIDSENSFMHRVTGEFEWMGDSWWLHNRGSVTRLVLFGSDGLRAELPTGTSTILTADTGTISFVAGPSPYELTYRNFETTPALTPEQQSTLMGEHTVQFGSALTPREIETMIEFARPKLMGNGAAYPTYAEVAAVCHVSEKTIDNRLQKIRQKLKESGVANVDSLDGLIAHLLANGKITVSQMMKVEDLPDT